MRIKGVIFDFDGVIVDSMALHLWAWDRASLKLYGKKIDDPTRLAGRSTDAIASILAGEQAQPSTASELAEAKRDELRASSAPAPLFPGVSECFAFLRQSGLPFGIASNAPHKFIEATLRDFHLNVDVVMGIEDSVRPKPFPDPFLLCAKHLGIHHDDHKSVIVFEDSRHGLGAAVKAGMIAIGVTTQHPAHELKESGAVLTCSHLRDALDRGFFSNLPL